jgi:hypothetical protein
MDTLLLKDLRILKVLLSKHLLRLHQRQLLAHLSELLLLRLHLLHLHLVLLLLHHHIHELGLALRDLMGIHRRLWQLAMHHLIAIDRLSNDLAWDTHSLDHTLGWLHLRLHQLLAVRSCLLLRLQLLLGLLLHLIHHVLLLRDTLRLVNLHRNILRSNIYFILV